MARIVQPLTNTQVANTKATDADKSLYDGDGLLLLIKKSGAKIWRFRYFKPLEKNRTTVTFGNYPALSLANARKMRDAALELLAQGIDPQEHKQSENKKILDKKNNTFKKVAKDWFAIESKKDFTADTLKRKWNSLETHVLKFIGEEPITSITAQQLIKVLQPLSEKNNLDMLRRVIHRINQVMIYAQNTGLITINRAQNIKSAFETAKTNNMPTIRPEDLPDFMKALSIAGIELQTKCVIEWQLLTMTRPKEAASTEWTEIDINKKLWTIPADKMKMKREHIIPLSNQAMRIINIMNKITGHNKYVFPTMIAPHNKPMSSETANNAIKNKVGYKGRLVAHGFRSLASTTLNEQKFNPDAIEVALSHVDRNKIRRAYNHALYLEERKIMMQWWGDFVEQASQGNVSLSGNRSLKIVNN